VVLGILVFWGVSKVVMVDLQKGDKGAAGYLAFAAYFRWTQHVVLYDLTFPWRC
jgi:hypothetical protein